MSHSLISAQTLFTTIKLIINAVKQYGVEIFPQPTGKILVDMDDLIFYEVTMEKRDEDAYLVTGPYRVRTNYRLSRWF